MNKRKLSLKKYGISNKRYKELCGFCEQYPEWKAKIAEQTDTLLGSAKLSGMPTAHNGSDTTSAVAIKCADLQVKCDLVEKTAKQAGGDLSDFLIKSVCYEVPINYLIACEGMSCSMASFYDVRRYFFYLLDKNKKM